MRYLAVFSLIGLLSGASGAAMQREPAIASAGTWRIGPIIRGRNYSVGMPLAPTPSRGGWQFDFPYPDVRAGHVHYVTFNPGPLLGRSRIVVRYRIDAARGVRFVPQESPEMPGIVSLFFQRRGDNWSGRRHYEYYRWYAPDPTVREVAPGVHEMTASLNDSNWISVNGRLGGTNPEAFEDALAETDSIGLVFGSTAARGHGVYATGPARFTLVSFQIL